MKRKKLLEFAAWFAKQRTTFVMSSTCDCIGGHAKVFMGLKRPVPGRWDVKRDWYETSLREAMVTTFNLTDKQAAAACFDWPGDDVSKAWALRMLRKLAATGKVDWEGTRSSR